MPLQENLERHLASEIAVRNEGTEQLGSSQGVGERVVRLVARQPVALPQSVQAQAAAGNGLVALLQSASYQGLGIGQWNEKAASVQPPAGGIQKLALDPHVMAEQHPAREPGDSKRGRIPILPIWLTC